VGLGTTFTIVLPATQESAEGSTAQEEPLRTGAGVILVVEDEAPLLTLISGTLKRAGYRVLEARNGSDALSIVEDIPQIDLLLTDVVMPGMTGPQLVESLQQQGAVHTVLFMSGYAQELAGCGTSEITFLPKPFTPNSLLDKIHEVLGAGKRCARPNTAF
jgi:CheY-like chemotaxis protein